MKKRTVGIMLGGRSAEHEVSVQSALNVYKALDKKKYNVKVIGIGKSGTFHLLPSEGLGKLPAAEIVLLIKSLSDESLPQDPFILFQDVDVMFPVLHGPFGEDGSLQGMLKQLQMPFVGASVLGSAIGMDKDVTKRLLRDARILVAKFLTTTSLKELSFAQVKKELGMPVFVKPANLGSSVGISKVSTEKEYKSALEKAFVYDRKIIIEETIIGKEIECSVLGNDEMIASVPGEIISSHTFYDYDAKYVDDKGAVLQIPAKLPNGVINEIKQTAIKVCKTLCVEGMARVDFFVTEDHTIYVNEINTIPGFTNISMYPKLWEKSGISYTELIDRLIELAESRFEEEQKLRTSF